MKTCISRLIHLFILEVVGVHGSMVQVCEADCPPRSSVFSVQLISPIDETARNIWFIASVSSGKAPIQVQFVVVTNIFNQATNVVLATVTNSPYVFVGSSTNMPPLTYPNWGYSMTLTAVATDAMGNSVTSPPARVNGIQGAFAPQTGSIIVSPTAGTVVPRGAPLMISTMFWDLSGVPLPVDFYAGTNFLGTVNPWPGLLMFTSGVSWTLTPYTLAVSNLPPGNYDLTSRSGNPVNPYEYGVSPPVHITVLPADIPPTVNLVGVPPNIYLPPGTTATPYTAYAFQSTVRVEALASDQDGTINRVNFYVWTNLVTVATNAPYVLLLTNPPPAFYKVTAEAIDNGGESGISQGVDFLVVTNPPSPPVVDLVSPPDGTRLHFGIAFPVEAALRVSDNNINPVEFYAGTNWVGSVLNPPYRLMVSNLAVGAYTLSARIKSLSGLASTGAVAQVRMSDFLLYPDGFDKDGNFHLRVGGLVPGTTNVVEASPDLTGWTSLTTNMVTTNYLDFVDVGATNDCQRFYRCVRIP